MIHARDLEFPVQSLMEVTERPEIVFVKGQGAWLTDHRGKRYLDFVQGWAVTCLGHCPRVVGDALAAQARELITPSPAFYVEGFPKATLNDLASVEERITGRTAAVMLEPVQGEGGVVPATVEFLRELRALTRRRNCLMIVDEVQTGVGRTGRLWAYEHFARSAADAPDIMTLGKGFGGGVPLAALCATEKVSVFEHGEQGGTFNGSPLMTAVGCAVLEEVLRPGFLRSVVDAGNYLGAQLTTLVRELGLSHERGLGLLRALDLDAGFGSRVVTYARDELQKHPGWENTGLLLNSPRPDAIRLMPALNVTGAEIDRMIEGLRVAIDAVR
ncbi:MAG: aminotransferase class III-fold pyridoxal phosphate-dependent enzyme [Candidatus Rokubacteria bacterium]|nr:aminotransferase class III-fold pyridoxal phosphate-dependent enzyme [Candidatus Rokubacteria bacterium]